MTTAATGALDRQHVLVTGGSSGIGKACAARYRAEGATVDMVHLNAGQEFVTAMGIPVIEPSRVAEAAMQAIATRANGSQWIVWGDIIRQHEQTAFEL